MKRRLDLRRLCCMRMREWRQIKRTTVEKDVIENEIRISLNMFKEFFTGKIFSYRCSNTKGEKNSQG